MKIVAFLQNMWVKNSRTVWNVMKHDATSDVREKMIAYALFAGCLTGRRLRDYLGVKLCEEIVWQEASTAVSTDPKLYFPPEPVHIRAVLNKHKPNVVLCFTKAGEGIIRTMLDDGMTFIPCVHPACRANNVFEKLTGVRKAIEALSK